MGLLTDFEPRKNIRFMLVEIQCLNVDDSGYDDTGYFRGIGRPLFYVFCANPQINKARRARSLDDLKARLKNEYPNHLLQFIVV